MACGYAKFTGRLGVCIATSGPGAIHLLNGLYDAKMDGAPVLAITGQTYHDLMGMHYQQEVNLLGLFKDVAGLQPADQWARSTPTRWSTPPAARRSGRKGVAHINCPNDWQDLTTETGLADERAGAHVASPGRRRSSCPQAESLASAAALLNAGKKTVIMVGQGRTGATDEIERIAELLAAPVVKALLGKDVVPDDSPVLHRRPRPARHAPVREGDGGVRQPLPRRHELPVHELPAQARARRRPSRSTATRRGSASATRSTSA